MRGTRNTFGLEIELKRADRQVILGQISSSHKWGSVITNCVYDGYLHPERSPLNGGRQVPIIVLQVALKIPYLMKIM